MDSISDLMNLIPQLFIYIIPGYIALNIKKHFRQEYDYEDNNIVLMSIVLSFIIDKILFVIVKFVSISINFILQIYNYKIDCILKILETGSELNIIAILIFSVFVGYIITIYPDSNLSNKISKLFNSNNESYSTVWNYAMKSKAWVRVYIHDENIGYTGQLIRYTCNPNKELREVYLRCFTSFKMDSNTIVDDYGIANKDEKKFVLINVTEIKRIEIFVD